MVPLSSIGIGLVVQHLVAGTWPPCPAQNGSNLTDAGQPRLPVKAMAGASPAYPAEAALARPVTGLLIRSALGSFTLAHSARAKGGRHDHHHIHSFAQRYRAITRRDCSTPRRATATAVTRTVTVFKYNNLIISCVSVSC
jgi:hypothetical protein